MKATAAESAELKMALKHDPVTPELELEAERFPAEAEEAVYDVLLGHDVAAPGSWVEREIRENHPPCPVCGSTEPDCEDDCPVRLERIGGAS